MSALPDIRAFRLMECGITLDEPYQYLDQAFGVAELLNIVLKDDGNAVNPNLTAAAADAIGTLTWLAAYTLEVMASAQTQREARP